MVHDPNHAAVAPAARESETRAVLIAPACSTERVQVLEGKRSPAAELFVRACEACTPRVTQREIVRALRSIGVKCWPSQVARWQQNMTPTRIAELVRAIPRFGRAYADVLTELAVPVPVGEDPTGAALDACDKAGHLAGLVRARTRGVEVERASQDAITAVRRVRAACRGAA